MDVIILLIVILVLFAAIVGVLAMRSSASRSSLDEPKPVASLLRRDREQREREARNDRRPGPLERTGR